MSARVAIVLVLLCLAGEAFADAELVEPAIGGALPGPSLALKVRGGFEYGPVALSLDGLGLLGSGAVGTARGWAAFPEARVLARGKEARAFLGFGLGAGQLDYHCACSDPGLHGGVQPFFALSGGGAFEVTKFIDLGLELALFDFNGLSPTAPVKLGTPPLSPKSQVVPALLVTVALVDRKPDSGGCLGLGP